MRQPAGRHAKWVDIVECQCRQSIEFGLQEKSEFFPPNINLEQICFEEMGNRLQTFIVAKYCKLG